MQIIPNSREPPTIAAIFNGILWKMIQTWRVAINSTYYLVKVSTVNGNLTSILSQGTLLKFKSLFGYNFVFIIKIYVCVFYIYYVNELFFSHLFSFDNNKVRSCALHRAPSNEKEIFREIDANIKTNQFKGRLILMRRIDVR